MDNQEKNKGHYESLYAGYNVKNIFYWIQHLDDFLEKAVTTEISWAALYSNNFRERLKGRKVIELGCGDCVNVAVMAALGAEVYANDIASASGKIIEELNRNFDFDHPIVFVEGDFLENDLPSREFDFVVGKAFLHHLTIQVERKFLQETSRLLKPSGEARFFEPAVNNKLMDKLRWAVPVEGRPSILQNRKFKTWKESDPHPTRSFSSRHFLHVCREGFKEVDIFPFGTLERFSRFFSWGEKKNLYKRWAIRNERKIVRPLNLSMARSQLIVCKDPIW